MRLCQSLWATGDLEPFRRELENPNFRVFIAGKTREGAIAKYSRQELSAPLQH